MAGIYLHIPFCKQKCHYCGFHFSTTYEKYRGRMIDAMIKELQFHAPQFTETINTIYFGGGTPSLLTEIEMDQLLNAIQKHYFIPPTVEITLEANPDDFTKAKVSTWKKAGINRLSIGIQSFQEEDLRIMNRAHHVEDALNAVVLAREAGFENLSVDLMFALPSLDNEAWIKNVQTAIDLKIPHISCYNLTVEEQSAIKKLIADKRFPPVSEERGIEQFQIVMEMLSNAGYEQYELSNYALPGARSKHNSNYWTGENYLGIGPSAHSFLKGKRSFNVAHNMRYIQGAEINQFNRKHENLSTENRYNEFILTRLRTIEGVPLELVSELFPQEIKAAQMGLNQNIESKNLRVENGSLQLTNQGKLLADQIAMELFA